MSIKDSNNSKFNKFKRQSEQLKNARDVIRSQSERMLEVEARLQEQIKKMQEQIERMQNQRQPDLETQEKISILIADDHPFLLAGLPALINTEPDMVVVAEAANGKDAIDEVIRKSPDVVVMDLSMPKLDGIKAMEYILKSFPNTRILILTMHDDPAYLNTILSAGALGYLVKSSADTQLVPAIRSVYKRQIFIDPTLIKVTKQPENLLKELPRGNGELIMIVDNDASIREITRATLEAYNYRALAASNGDEVLALFTRYMGEVNLILIDLMIPYPDSLSTINIFRQLLEKVEPTIRFITTSTEMPAPISEASDGANVKAFLSKPYTAEKLLQTISEAFQIAEK